MEIRKHQTSQRLEWWKICLTEKSEPIGIYRASVQSVWHCSVLNWRQLISLNWFRFFSVCLNEVEKTYGVNNKWSPHRLDSIENNFSSKIVWYCLNVQLIISFICSFNRFGFSLVWHFRAQQNVSCSREVFAFVVDGAIVNLINIISSTIKRNPFHATGAIIKTQIHLTKARRRYELWSRYSMSRVYTLRKHTCLPSKKKKKQEWNVKFLMCSNTHHNNVQNFMRLNSIGNLAWNVEQMMRLRWMCVRLRVRMSQRRSRTINFN